MAATGRGALARATAFAAVAALAVIVFLAGRALLGGEAVARPSAPVDASASAPAPSASPSMPSAVPAELLDKAWIAFDGTRWQVGTVGAGPMSLLPSDELGLAADAGLVLSIDSATSSTVFVREVSTGKLVHEMRTDFRVDDGVIRGDGFYLTGIIKDGDAGVWLGRIGDVALVQLIPASEGPLLGDRTGFRTGIKLSPAGRTLASTVCVAPECVTQIVSTDGGVVLTIADSIARWVSEDYVVINERPRIRAYGLDDGQLRWQLNDLDFWDGYFTSDGRTFIAQAQTESGVNEIWRVDAETGAHNVVTANLAADQYLIATLSSDRYGLLLNAFSVDHAFEIGADLKVVDLNTGELVLSRPFPRSAP